MVSLEHLGKWGRRQSEVRRDHSQPSSLLGCESTRRALEGICLQLPFEAEEKPDPDEIYQNVFLWRKLEVVGEMQS